MIRPIIFCFLLLASSCASQDQSIFELKPAQSMSITGKGEGQDAAYNPYMSDAKSIAIVESLSKNPITIRIQSEGRIIETMQVDEGETKELTLLKGYELYLDSQLKARARVTFQAFKEED